jgi:hypothetical protein
VSDGPEPDLRTERQREWATWAEHGYSKRYQPRQMLWIGGGIMLTLILGFLAIFYLAFRAVP